MLTNNTQKQQQRMSKELKTKQFLHANNPYVEEEHVPNFLFAGKLHRMSVRNFTIQILSNVWSTHHEKPCPYFLKQP